MPWCEECAKYWTPGAMNPDGTCPQCGRPVEAPTIQPTSPAGEGEDGDEDVRVPWHFKLLVVALVLYLGWRIIDLIR